MLRRITLLAVLACGTTLRAGPARITTFAGTGVSGYSGDGGPASAAQLNFPTGMCRAPDGALYICDTGNHAIRKISADGIISTIAGNGKDGDNGDGSPAKAALLNDPFEIRLDGSGNLFFCERSGGVIRRIDAKTRIITRFAGTGEAGFAGDGGPATKAEFREPHSLAFGPDGNLYIGDLGNGRVRRIDMETKIITTIAGTGLKKPAADNLPFATATLPGPRALDFDRDGNIWLVLRNTNAIVKLDLSTGLLHHIAGTGAKGLTGNGGPAIHATLAGPKGISIAPDGRVFIADTDNHSIRVIDPRTGVIQQVAGTGQKGDGVDGDPLKCQLNQPHGILVDSTGAIFIGDSMNNKVRVISSEE